MFSSVVTYFALYCDYFCIIFSVLFLFYLDKYDYKNIV